MKNKNILEEIKNLMEQHKTLSDAIFKDLSPRDLQVLLLLLKGTKNVSEISEKLEMHETNVLRSFRHIREKNIYVDQEFNEKYGEK